jgi:uncharacterized small protein (DUF1192 family)
MANEKIALTPDYYMKLLAGELTAQIAILRAENDALREQLAQKSSRHQKESRMPLRQMNAE